MCRENKKDRSNISTGIDVAAALIFKDQKIFAARRKNGLELAGYWEFPGGKLEEGESAEECLSRELLEEFSITTKIGEFFCESIHDYGTKVVRLLAFRTEHLAGDFTPVDHDELRWLSIQQLDQVQWAPADIPIVDMLKKLSDFR